ncbi:hypothetical protein SS50377_24629 [Spironucleus salmonicida]|uniref:Uncharacterized protein n=1 Tax=Spironucleus salmonicida TaxID=348837 RepID=V6LIT8_9EUKA|nr:hypothetical protein SS50377_24629 [Spironucleus salmonicida]|eukprot:EST44520.1 Hypothetical protein SS50377_15518 [Spironucleus salmonicida]
MDDNFDSFIQSYKDEIYRNQMFYKSGINMVSSIIKDKTQISNSISDQQRDSSSKYPLQTIRKGRMIVRKYNLPPQEERNFDITISQKQKNDLLTSIIKIEKQESLSKDLIIQEQQKQLDEMTQKIDTYENQLQNQYKNLKQQFEQQYTQTINCFQEQIKTQQQEIVELKNRIIYSKSQLNNLKYNVYEIRSLVKEIKTLKSQITKIRVNFPTKFLIPESITSFIGQFLVGSSQLQNSKYHATMANLKSQTSYGSKLNIRKNTSQVEIINSVKEDIIKFEKVYQIQSSSDEY